MTKLLSLVLVAGCAGGNPELRNDVIGRMQSIKPALDSCYETALARNRKLPGGMITVELVAEASTGQFKNVLIRRDELQDPAVRQCVIVEVSKQKLAKPTSANTQIPYAFRFIPQ
jgi:hypothetical protein